MTQCGSQGLRCVSQVCILPCFLGAVVLRVLESNNFARILVIIALFLNERFFLFRFFNPSDRQARLD